MKHIQWQDKFSTGHPGVDYEHQEMIEMINVTLDKINFSTQPDEINEMLGDIHVGIAAHFALEEEAMRKVQYPDYQEHKDDHELLLDAIRNIMDNFDGVPGKHVKTRLSNRLISWFSVHFSTLDAKLHDVIG